MEIDALLFDDSQTHSARIAFVAISLLTWAAAIFDLDLEHVRALLYRVNTSLPAKPVPDLPSFNGPLR